MKFKAGDKIKRLYKNGIERYKVMGITNNGRKDLYEVIDAFGGAWYLDISYTDQKYVKHNEDFIKEQK